MSIFKGIGTALITPFCESGCIDYDAFAGLVDFQIENGVAALVVCGTTGEAATLSDGEKQSLISFAVKEAKGRVKVIAGVGGNNTDEVACFARQVQDTGVDAILSVTPYYNKTTQDGLFYHYSKIASATALPMIVYNVPSRTGVNIAPETLQRLTEIPNIVGIKEASGNMAQTVEMLSLCGNRIDLFSGNDDMSVPIYSVGGKGTISVLSNIMPKEMSEMAKLFFYGNVYGAAKLQKSLFEIMKCMFAEVNPIPVKYAAKRLGLCNATVRLPLVLPSEKTKKQIDSCLEKYGLPIKN